MSGRVIYVGGPISGGGNCGNANQPSWPAKDPGDLEVLSADFRFLTGGTALAGVAVTVSPAGAVSIASQTVSGTVASIIVQGGVDGVPATVIMTVTTVDGFVYRRGVTLPIIAMAPPGGATPTTLAGVITTDATPTPVGVLTVPGASGYAVSITGTVTARNTATNASLVFDVAAAIANLGLNTANVTMQEATVRSGDATMVACTLFVWVSGSTISLIGTGVAGANIGWTASITPGIA